MKIKLKNGAGLGNNWKQCGCSEDDWKMLKDGKVINIDSVPEIIKNEVDVVEETTKTKIKTQGDK
mgnify:FL=1|tara:strand:+ start:261 stop:455 length:195 start_codon:yes stop_codon:yes gene_type:complete